MSPQEGISPANSRDEWLKIARLETSSFIRNLADWDAFVRDEIKEHPLGALDSVSLAHFRDQLKFVEITVNGKPIKRCCINWFYGDLLEKHRFNQEQLMAVAALFGIGPLHFNAQADKFGDICDDEVCCRPRVGYSCPDGAGDCTC